MMLSSYDSLHASTGPFERSAREPWSRVKELTAADYSYEFPDHWLLERTPFDLFAVLHAAYVLRVVEIVRESGARTVLEAGCGDGWNCGKLAEAGLEVTGVEWSKNAVEHARRLVPRARFHCGDLLDPAFRERFTEPYDAVILVEVLEHIPPADCVEALRKITSVLKPGGTFVLTTPSVNQPNQNPAHYRHFEEGTLREVIREAGSLEITAIEGYGDVPGEVAHWRMRRWIDNRFWTVKPLQKLLVDRYAARCSRTALSVCQGFIVTMRKSA